MSHSDLHDGKLRDKDGNPLIERYNPNERTNHWVTAISLILLTLSAVLLELAVAREARSGGERAPHVLATAWSAFRGALIHPIPLPIVCGLLFAQTGWTLPAVVDKPLQLLGSAFGPLALVLVGVTLSRTPLRGHWRDGAGWR